MVNSRLLWFLESKNLLSSSQYGFRQGLSTADPLTFLETYILSAFASKQVVLAVFFDLEKAYDTTWRYHILHQLYSWNITGNMEIFLQSLLSHRSFQVRIANTLSPSYTQYEGVPQGSVLSTTLLLLLLTT